ncbi:MAG: histidine kinase dimerization/phospho-acceptor domain-containing protein [Lautropia sp.]
MKSSVPDPDASQRSGDGGSCDPEIETAVLLDAVIHDLRTPLSAMSGWLEVLEAHVGESTDDLLARALRGLRRSVDAQAGILNTLSETLAQQRRTLGPHQDCLLLERLQQAMGVLESRRAAVSIDLARLAPLRHFSGAAELTCVDAGPPLTDACAVLLQALAIAQSTADGPIVISGGAAQLRITVPGGSGDRAPLRGLCQGFGGYGARRPDLRIQTLWLARSMLRRCGLDLRMAPGDAGFDLLIGRLGA